MKTTAAISFVMLFSSPVLGQPYRNRRQITLSASDLRQVNRATITRADGQLYAPVNSIAVQKIFNEIHKQTARPRRVLLDHGRVVIQHQGFLCSLPGGPGSGFWYAGLGFSASSSSLPDY